MIPAMAPVAVVILNWNGEKMLAEFLPQVIAATPAALGRVVVADNGSTDGSLALLRDRFPSVSVIELGENFGFAEGYNRAIALVDEPYTVLLNSDVAPDHGWLEPLHRYMEANPDAGAAQPKILSYADPSRFEYAGACGGYLDRHGYPYCRGRIFAECETDRGQYDTTASVDWASGAALMVRTALYRSVGGMDAGFFAHMEEIDLCWRIRLAGYKVVAVPEGSVRHLGGGTLPMGNPRKTYLNFRNNLLLLHKNLPARTRRHALIVRRLYDTLAWCRYVACGHWADARAVVRAHRDFRRMRRDYPDAPAQTDMLAQRPDIVIQSFLRGVKRYSEIRK